MRFYEHGHVQIKALTSPVYFVLSAVCSAHPSRKCIQLVFPFLCKKKGASKEHHKCSHLRHSVFALAVQRTKWRLRRPDITTCAENLHVWIVARARWGRTGDWRFPAASTSAGIRVRVGGWRRRTGRGWEALLSAGLRAAWRSVVIITVLIARVHLTGL